MYLLYFLLWVIFNGQVTLEICLFGIVIAAVILAFTCRFMDYSIERELRLYRRIGKMGGYIWLLICEIIKANLNVFHMILSEREEVSPVLVEFDANLSTPVGRAFMANAITLTPGTITVLLEDSSYLVHCLDESLAPGLADSEFTKRIRELEQDELAGKRGRDKSLGGGTEETDTEAASAGGEPEKRTDSEAVSASTEAGESPDFVAAGGEPEELTDSEAAAASAEDGGTPDFAAEEAGVQKKEAKGR